MSKILIIGRGWLGGRCAQEWPDAVVSEKIIKTEADALAILDEHRPDAVLNAAGIVGKPNVDWCETHQLETVMGNTVLPLILAAACAKRGAYLLHMGTGCIFYGPAPHGGPWNEDDYANPVAVYTRAKYAADLALATLPNVGIARIRMPVDIFSSPGNLIDKLAVLKKVVDVENSITVVPDMIEAFRQLLEKKAAGVFHCTNPGSIRHREILALYEELVNPAHTNDWITEGELVACGLAAKKRSNNIMQSRNLEKFGIRMRPVQTAVRETMIQYAQNLKK